MTTELTTDPSRLERRGAQRFEIHLPLAVHFNGTTVPAFTQDLSGRGIFFFAETALPQGAVVELTFTMPSEVTLAENMPVRCRARILRASGSQAGQRTGIAAQLDSYHYLPADEPVAQFVRVSTAGPVASVSTLVPR